MQLKAQAASVRAGELAVLQLGCYWKMFINDRTSFPGIFQCFDTLECPSSLRAGVGSKGKAGAEAIRGGG